MSVQVISHRAQVEFTPEARRHRCRCEAVFQADSVDDEVVLCGPTARRDSSRVDSPQIEIDVAAVATPSQIGHRLLQWIDSHPGVAAVDAGGGVDEEDAALDATLPLTIVPTFLGAHAVPTEFAHDPAGYVDLVVEEMLPAAADSGIPRFCDIFCDVGAFTLEQSRRVLTAARALGMIPKIHADEFESLGGTALAVELGAISADHLVRTTATEIELLGHADTVAVALPATPFGLGHRDYTPASDILAAGGILALATDCNPGTAWCESMPFVIALACRTMHLTPAQALVAATLNSAYAVGLGEEVGSLEVDRAADVIILDLPDVNHLGYRFGANPVQRVIKGGRIIL